MKPFDPSRVIIGRGSTSLESFVKVLETYDLKGYPAVVFIEPQMRGVETHAYIYRFFGLNFMIEMIALPVDRDRNDAVLAKVAVLVKSLGSAQEATIESEDI